MINPLDLILSGNFEEFYDKSFRNENFPLVIRFFMQSEFTRYSSEFT